MGRRTVRSLRPERTASGDHRSSRTTAGACISNVVPALLEPPDAAARLVPRGVADADQVVLLVLDGLGWDQLQERRDLAPDAGADGRAAPITTVAPSTTATALTSITTGPHPGRARRDRLPHRRRRRGAQRAALVDVDGATPAASIPPDKFQPIAPFLGHRPPVVTRAEFRTQRLHARPPRRRPLQRLPGDRRRW